MTNFYLDSVRAKGQTENSRTMTVDPPRVIRLCVCCISPLTVRFSLRAIQPGSAQGFLLRRCVFSLVDPILQTFWTAEQQCGLNCFSIPLNCHRNAVTL